MNSLINYKPIGAFDMLGDFNKVLDSFFGNSPAIHRARIPSVNIREDENAYVLEAELPGLTQKDVDVSIAENVLTISSAKNEEKEETKGGYLIRERSESSFKRSFVLPQNVNKEAIAAKFKNGLLILEMQKHKKEEKTRSIAITTE